MLGDASGTPSVCICFTHKNIQLMLDGAKLNTNYKDLLDSILCDIKSEECMLSECPWCSGPKAVRNLLQLKSLVVVVVVSDCGGDIYLDAEWNFFETSLGKSPCDNIGGTIECLISKASFQRTSTDQILTPEDLFAYGQARIDGITFFYVKREEVESNEFLEETFKKSTRMKRGVSMEQHRNESDADHNHLACLPATRQVQRRRHWTPPGAHMQRCSPRSDFEQH
ncbi:hypothetical protein PR048_011272 [Dryococelus australis]|uniref:Uncharacterized protein n=1 Tax=Dryococelus australis TaxID=614101 RepID=A0ABQ9HL45_9NEOP|nr:hypothetical protein PR048_011272 [Dryococelus australis]